MANRGRLSTVWPGQIDHPVEYLTGDDERGPARLKVIVRSALSRLTPVYSPVIDGCPSLADKTGSRSGEHAHRTNRPVPLPLAWPTATTTTRRVHGRARAVAIPRYASYLTLMHARSICCYKTDVPGITLRRCDPPCEPTFRHICRPEEHASAHVCVCVCISCVHEAWCSSLHASTLIFHRSRVSFFSFFSFFFFVVASQRCKSIGYCTKLIGSSCPSLAPLLLFFSLVSFIGVLLTTEIESRNFGHFPGPFHLSVFRILE